MPEGLMDEVKTALKDVENQTGKKFGDAENPLLVSVRSGARLSMPGMMETILNLGMNDKTVEGMIKLTNNITWLGALFNSVSARTAGFSTFNLSNFSNAGIIVMIVLMFIGASPGSTGGGIKTTTVFVLFKGIVSAATNKGEKAFKYAIPKNAFRKAAVVTVLGINVVLIGTFLISIFEPQLELRDILFEVVSAYGTVGLTTGITTSLSAASKILSMIIMFIGRLGPMTIVTLWYFSRGERISYPEGNISIG